VSVVGDFNDWNPTGTPLRRRGAGEWSLTLPLHPGRYRFSFLLDGRTWVSDPRLPSAPDPDFGAPTSILTVEPSAP
jgi:1,4-alpha-glucan branching enzyme